MRDFAAIGAASAKLPDGAVLDGEIVAWKEEAAGLTRDFELGRTPGECQRADKPGEIVRRGTISPGLSAR